MEGAREQRTAASPSLQHSFIHEPYSRIPRYRSATLYNDGNPLAVVDSEMPNIGERLGLRRPGAPLPAPRFRGHGWRRRATSPLGAALEGEDSHVSDGV